MGHPKDFDFTQDSTSVDSMPDCGSDIDIISDDSMDMDANIDQGIDVSSSNS